MGDNFKDIVNRSKGGEEDEFSNIVTRSRTGKKRKDKQAGNYDSHGGQNPLLTQSKTNTETKTETKKVQSHKVTKGASGRRTTSDKRVQLGTLEERKGKQAVRQDRVMDAIKGTGKNLAGSYGSAIGATMQSVNPLELTKSLTKPGGIGNLVRDTVMGDIRNDGDSYSDAVFKNAGRQLTKKSDELIQSGSKDIDKAKDGLGKVGQFAVDVGTQGLMMGSDALLNIIAPGAGMMGFYGRAAGASASEARREGADEDQQLLYGAASGLMELGLERLFSAGKYLKGMYGQGALDMATPMASRVATSNLVKGIVKSPQGQELVYQLTKAGFAMNEEGIEEALADLISPLLKRAVYTDEIEMPDAGTVLYDYLVGAASGGLFGAAGTVADYKSGVGRMNQMQENGTMAEDMINRAAVQGEKTSAGQFAQQLSAQRDSGKAVLGGQLNDLQRMTAPEQLKHETELMRQKEEADRKRMAGDVSKFNRTGTERENRAIVEISSGFVKDKVSDVEKIVAENADLSVTLSGDSATFEAVAKVATGTATADDIDRILMKPAAKALVKEYTGVSLPVENTAARKSLENLVVFTGAEHRTEILAKAKARVAEDMASSLGARGSAKFTEMYPNVNEQDNEKFYAVFKRFYNAGEYSMPIETVSKLVDDMGTEYQAVVDRYFTPEVRTAIHKAGFADSKVETAKNEESVIRHENIADRAKKGVFEDHTTGEHSKTMKKALKSLAKRTGVNIVFVDTLGDSNGIYDNGTIYLAADADRLLITVAKHELTHYLKQYAPKEYQELEDYVFTELNGKKNIEKKIEQKIRQYAKQGHHLTRSAAKEEILADMAEAFFTDESAIDRVIAYSKELGEAILDGIRTILDTFLVIAEEDKNKKNREYGKILDEIGILRDAERLWMKALQASLKNDVVAKESPQEKVSHSLIGRDADGIEIYETSNEVKNLSWKERKKRARDLLFNEFSGRTVKLIKNNQKIYAKFEKADIKKSLYGDSKSDQKGKDAKVNVAADGNIYELVEHSKYTGSSNEQGKLIKSHEDVTDWDYFVKEVAVDGIYYKELINVRQKPDGEYVYEVNLWENANKKGIVPHKTQDIYKDKRRALQSEATKPSDDSISNTEANGNSKHSLKDTEDRDLSPAQQKYFAKSKVRDAQGRLKVMYHGSGTAGFTVFDSGKADDGRSFFFSDSLDVASGYSATNRMFKPVDFKTPEELQEYILDELGEEVEIRNDGDRYALYQDGEFVVRDDDLYSLYWSYSDEIVGWGGESANYEVYLNLENPLIIDADNNNWDEIPVDWTEELLTTRAIAEYASENGYDGVMINNVIDTGLYGKRFDVSNIAIAFNSNQVKSVANTEPTAEPDIRFSLKEPVEETKDLIAVHNMQSIELLKTLDLGGFPMPSIAIIKAKAGHNEYGDTSVVFGKDTIDPEFIRTNKVYGGDAWTPTYPKVEYKANAKAEKRISDFYYDFARRFGYDEAKPLYNYVHELEEQLNRNNGAEGILSRLQDDIGLMQMYLMDSGKGKVENIETETVTELSEAEVEMNDYLINVLGEDLIKGYKTTPGVAPMTHRKKWLAENQDKIEAAYSALMREVYGFDEEGIENVLIGMKPVDYMKLIRDALYYLENGPKTVKTEVDYTATNAKVRENASEGYTEWLNKLFSGLEEKRGIRNNADIFTRSGNRRSWEALHWEETLENVVRVMKEGENGTGFFGGTGLWGVAAKEYGSIAEIKADSYRLEKISEEEYQQIKDEIGQRFQEIAECIMDKQERNQFIAMDNAMECMVDAVRKSKTKSGIMKELKQYRHLTVTQQNVDDLVSVVQDIASMPTGYFEAKPRRAVGLDEIKAIILPSDVDSELLSRLQDGGYNIVQYEAGNAEDRVEKLNSIENVRFQLKEGPSYDRKVQTLEERVAYLKSEMKKTGLKTPVEKDTKVQASKLLKKYDSNMVLHTKLVDTMKDIFKVFKTTTDWTSAEAMAEDMARQIVDKIAVLHDESWQEYKELRKHLKTVSVAVSEADKASMTDYESFRKANMGRIKLTNNQGLSVDQYYQSLMESWPEKFTDEYTNPADQLYHIEDVLNSLAPWYETYDSDQMQELVLEIADDIMATTGMLATRKTFADRKAEEKERAVDRVKRQRDEAMERMKERYEKKLIRQQKTSKEKMDAYKEKQKDRASRKKAMDRIQKNFDWLRERLLNPSDVSHIPEGYRAAVAELLEGFDFETDRTDAYEAKNGASKKVIRLRAFKDRFRQIMESPEGEAIELDPDFMAYMDEITDQIDGHRLSELDNVTLENVGLLLKQIKHQMSYINKCFNDEISEGIHELGESTIWEANEQKEAKEYTSVKMHVNKLLNESMVTPADMFELIGGAQKKLYQAMRNGFDRHVQNVQMAIQFTQTTIGDAKVKDWSQNKHTFTLESGKVEMTTTQLMTLYALMQREQAQGHILGSGIVMAPVELKVGKLKAKQKMAETHVMPTLEEVLEMVGVLTDEQRRIADEMRGFLSNECSEWGNRTSMKLYGYRKFTEKDYFPIKSSDSFLNENFDQKNVETSLKSMGFTKAVVREASNPIVIDDFFTVFTDHVNKMSMYEALVPAMTDFQRVYNYKQKADGKQVDSVQKALKRAYGTSATSYIKQFMEDLNGSQRTRNDAGIATSMISTYKKASIGGNLRVLLQQPTSLVRAFAVINPKYFSNTPATKKDIAEMKEHCSIAQWKSYGFYNTDVARDMKDIMMGESNLVDDVFMGTYGKADDWTWANIWKAVKKEVEAKNPNLKKGSDEYWQKVNERASYVYDRTQVVDSVFHRSQIMRNKGTFEKMVTSFMAEPTKTFNLLRTEIITAKRELTAGKKTEATKRVSRILGVYLLANMTTAMAAAIADAMRGAGGDDEEDKGNFGQRWWAHSISNFWDSANPLNMVPFAKDVVSMYSGYDVARMDMQGISKLLKVQSMWEGIADGSSKYTYGHVIRTTLETMSYFTGIPIKNLWRDAEGLTKSVAEAFGYGTAVKFEVAKWTYTLSEDSRNRATFADLYYDALAEGDRALANEILRYMRSQGVTEKYIKNRKKNWSESRGGGAGR